MSERTPRDSSLVAAFMELEKASTAIEAARRTLLSLPELRRSGRLEAALRAVDAAEDGLAHASAHVRAHVAPHSRV